MWRSRCSDRPKDWVQIGQAYRLWFLDEEGNCAGDVETEMDSFADIAFTPC